MMNLKAIAIASHPPAIIPAVGKGRELMAEKTIRGMKDLALKIAKIAPEIIVCITPHGNVFEDGISVLYDPVLKGDFENFNAKEIAMKKNCDMGLLDEMNRRFSDNDCYGLFINPKIAEEHQLSMALDHGVMVPLHYIDKVYPNYKIVHITIGDLSLYELYRTGRILREAIEVNGKRTVILACGDLSHVLMEDEASEFDPMGKVFDETMLNAITHQRYYDLLTLSPTVYEPAAQCGLRPIVMALGATDSIHTRSQVFAYEAPFGIGYMEALITFDLSGDDPTCESLLKRFEREIQEAYDNRLEKANPLIQLATKALSTWVKENRSMDEEVFINALEDCEEKTILCSPGACFVTIEKSGELRGCMGSVMPTTTSLASEIIRHTIEAAAYDPRFMAIEPEELLQCTAKVSLIGDIEAIDDATQLDPKRYGLILEQGFYRSVLLPCLPGIHTPEQQIEAAKRKAGIPEYDDVEIKLSRFEAITYS